MIHTIRIVVTAAVRGITFVFTLNLTLVNEKVFDELVGGLRKFQRHIGSGREVDSEHARARNPSATGKAGQG